MLGKRLGCDHKIFASQSQVKKTKKDTPGQMVSKILLHTIVFSFKHPDREVQIKKASWQKLEPEKKDQSFSWQKTEQLLRSLLLCADTTHLELK